MPKREIEINENELLWGRLFLAAKVVERAREIELSLVNVSLIQAMVLYALKLSPEPLTPSRLARMLCREPHSMSALIDRMEKQGLVEKKHDLSRKNVHAETLSTWRSRLIRRLTDRPEQFVKDGELVTGRPYKPLNSSQPAAYLTR